MECAAGCRSLSRSCDHAPSPFSTNRGNQMLRYRHSVAALAGVLVVATAMSFGARRADAHAVPTNCWWGIPNGPAHVGNNIVITISWQGCSGGVQQQFYIIGSLTSPSGTRYQNVNTCYNTATCSVTVTAPYSSCLPQQTWTAKADYADVTATDGTQAYFFGQADPFPCP